MVGVREREGEEERERESVCRGRQCELNRRSSPIATRLSTVSRLAGFSVVHTSGLYVSTWIFISLTTTPADRLLLPLGPPSLICHDRNCPPIPPCSLCSVIITTTTTTTQNTTLHHTTLVSPIRFAIAFRPSLSTLHRLSSNSATGPKNIDLVTASAIQPPKYCQNAGALSYEFLS
jgi:hypothetical protein